MRMISACKWSTKVCRQVAGFTLIELMVGIVVIGILLAVGAPNFKNWLQSAQIRTSAESMLNGLQIAKATAVNRNKNVLFMLTATLDATCAASVNGQNWIVSQNDPTGSCDLAPSETNPPLIIQKYSNAEGAPNAAASSTAATVTFDGFGRATSANIVGGNAATISISNPTGGACATDPIPGPMRCMDIQVTTGGRVRMCDPKLPATDPQGCS